MIKVLGVKRIAILFVLIAINAAIGSAAFLYLVPEKASRDRQLKTEQSKLNTKKADIQQLTVELSQLEEQQGEYEALEERGFFNDQNRRRAELILLDIKDASNVISAAAKIGGGVDEESEEAEKADHVLLVSPIEINVDALEDADVYRYVSLLKQKFPGHLSITELSLERRAEITGTIYRSIASGQNPKLVQAKLKMDWRTMIPKEQFSGNEDRR